MDERKLFKKYYKSPFHDYELPETMGLTDDEGRHPDIAFIYSGRNRHIKGRRLRIHIRYHLYCQRCCTQKNV